MSSKVTLTGMKEILEMKKGRIKSKYPNTAFRRIRCNNHESYIYTCKTEIAHRVGHMEKPYGDKHIDLNWSATFPSRDPANTDRNNIKNDFYMIFETELDSNIRKGIIYQGRRLR